ncbi:hypothetical protein [Paracoccus laeviglucosivorans]|uniref:Uncharacterized protein n=1 Tax=Paracoccus laeviglucosivorans TaxID=1197861 RepID=A0A521FU55_9RHOB|nr:hypothetical protein [Paracoccus laeviglucosivorans]SMO99765.1 hypothetical protein SAMN06265221_14910 [Paracoccus laeviglucosivorans]
MTPAKLTLDGSPPIDGVVDAGGDYITFRTRADVPPEQTRGPHEGEIEIDGRKERVVLESAHPTQSTPGMKTEDTFDLTLRRISPRATV